MDNLWSFEGLRILNFIVLFIAWCIMVYRAVLKLIINHKAFSWPRMMNLIWTTAALYGIGEILYEADIPGGFRVFLTCGVAFVQLYVSIFKMDFYDLEPGDEYIRP